MIDECASSARVMAMSLRTKECHINRLMTLRDIHEIEKLARRGEIDEKEEEKEGENLFEEDGFGADSEEEYVKEGRQLILRRTLYTKPTRLETQRERIFLTRCLVMDRMCELIIDTGSCTNVMSSTLVDKLSWPTTSHPLVE